MLQNPIPVATMSPSVPLSQEQPAAIPQYNPETAGLWLRDMEQKIIAGYKPDREEQKHLIALIRQGRAEAAAAAPKGKGKAKTKKQLSSEQLDADLDAALGL